MRRPLSVGLGLSFNLVAESSGGEDMLSQTVVLNDAQIKALPTTPFQVVAAPGAGKWLVPIMCVMEFTWVQPYTNVTDASLNQGASDIVVTWGPNTVNAFRAVPMIYFGAFFGHSRVAYCLPFQGVSVPTIAADQLWAAALAFPHNGFDQVENLEWNLCADNTGDFTGGDPTNKLVVTAWYQVRTFQSPTP